jgi:hypothetical protein
MAAPAPATNLQRCLETPVRWQQAADVDRPWIASIGPTIWKLQLNDFPAQPLYTLLIGDQSIGPVEDWPSCWAR